MDPGPMDLSEPKGRLARKIAQALKDRGFIAYFAGGCVRDHLRGQKPQDFDIATTATPEEVEKIFRKTIPVGKQFGVMVVVEEATHKYVPLLAAVPKPDAFKTNPA